MQGFSSHSSRRWLAAALGWPAVLAFGVGCNLSGIDTAESAGASYCEAFIDDYGVADGTACAEELACEGYTDAESCAFAPFVDGEDGLSVGCEWGTRFVGSYVGEMCGGEVEGVCVAAVKADDEAACAGYFTELNDGVSVLNLSCAEPITGDYSECSGTPYEDGVCTCAAG